MGKIEAFKTISRKPPVTTQDDLDDQAGREHQDNPTDRRALTHAQIRAVSLCPEATSFGSRKPFAILRLLAINNALTATRMMHHECFSGNEPLGDRCIATYELERQNRGDLRASPDPV